jgi:hypothetical protein
MGPQLRLAPPVEVPLWSQEDWVRWAVVVAAGLVMCVTGWYLAAGELSYNRQLGPTNLAVAGLIVAAAGHVWCFMRGRRRVGERRRQLIGEPIEMLGTTTSVASVQRSAMPVTVAGDGMRHYHRPECPLATGRDWPAGSPAQHEAAGWTPCGVCRP